jgi:hypothetical protein
MILAFCLLTLVNASAADGPFIHDLKFSESEPVPDSSLKLSLDLGAQSLLKDSGLAQNPFFNQAAPNAELIFKFFPFSLGKTGGFFISGGLGYNIYGLGIVPTPRDAWKFFYGTNYQNLFFDVRAGYGLTLFKNITGKVEVSDTFVPFVHENSPAVSTGLDFHF